MCTLGIALVVRGFITRMYCCGHFELAQSPHWTIQRMQRTEAVDLLAEAIIVRL